MSHKDYDENVVETEKELASLSHFLTHVLCVEGINDLVADSESEWWDFVLIKTALGHFKALL